MSNLLTLEDHGRFWNLELEVRLPKSISHRRVHLRATSFDEALKLAHETFHSLSDTAATIILTDVPPPAIDWNEEVLNPADLAIEEPKPLIFEVDGETDGDDAPEVAAAPAGDDLTEAPPITDQAADPHPAAAPAAAGSKYARKRQ